MSVKRDCHIRAMQQGGDMLTMQKKLARLKKKVTAEGNISPNAVLLTKTKFGHLLVSENPACGCVAPCITDIRGLLFFLCNSEDGQSIVLDNPVTPNQRRSVLCIDLVGGEEDEDIFVPKSTNASRKLPPTNEVCGWFSTHFKPC